MSKHATVTIIYGFTEGAWHGKRFRRVFREHGYSVTERAAEADIIIAHSAGAFYVPKSLRSDQLLILIDPPYWPERPIMLRSRNMVLHMIQSIRKDNHPFYQLHKTVHNFVYLVRHQALNREMIRHARTFDLAAELKHPRTILVRNRHDPWLTPDLEHLKLIQPKLRIRQLPGGHDDCWHNPQRYVNLLQSDI